MNHTLTQHGAEERRYKVTILLSKYGDPFSKIFKYLSGEFTHASISLDPEEDLFYSFNLKGFVSEHWKNKTSKYLLPERRYIRLYVSQEVFYKLRQNIAAFEKRKSELAYSPCGALLCLLRIPTFFKKRYFCSRFVAEVLHNSGAVKLRRKAALYLPMHFLKELG